MPRKLLSKAMAVCALVAALVLFGSAAEAKQCIWNKGGFVLRIDWFTPGTVTWATAADGVLEFSFTDQPIQTDVIWSGNGRCINRGDVQYQAVLSMCGAAYPTRVVLYPEVWTEDRRIDCSLNAVVVPDFARWWDVWGPIWEPQSGPGGPI